MPKIADLARKAVDVASEKQASDIHLLDISKVCAFADFFVIMNADSRRQMETVASEMEKALVTSGASLHHREGTAESGWMLLDFGDILVHIFAPEEREYYQLDEAWGKALSVVRIQ